MIDVVTPEYQSCVRYTEKNFWQNIVMSKELNDFISSNLPRLPALDSIYWVAGKRGSGKSQVLEIIARKCMENYKRWGILPVLVSVYGPEKEARPSEVLRILCQSIARSLIYMYDDFRTSAEFTEIPDQSGVKWDVGVLLETLNKFSENFSAEKFPDVSSLGKLLKQISQNKISYLLLIDELDKIDPIAYFGFLMQNQSFFSTLVSLQAKMMVSISDEVFQLIKDKQVSETNFYRGKVVRPPSIHTVENCMLLIESRIQMKKPDWRSPFDEASYMVIRSKCDGIPRDILRETGNILQKASDANLTVIPHRFVEKYFEDVDVDAEFEPFIKKCMSETTPIMRMLKELSSETVYPRILNSFILDPQAAKKGDYVILQALGDLGGDRSKYSLMVKEMEKKQLLQDRGYGPEVAPDLMKFMEEVSKKWGKNPIDVSNAVLKLTSDYLPPKTNHPVETPQKIDTAVRDIIAKYPLLNLSEIQEKFSDYVTSVELDNWKRVLPLRLVDMEKAGDVFKVGAGHDARFLTDMAGLTKDTFESLSDLPILRRLVSINNLRGKSDQKAFIDNLIDTLKEYIVQHFGLGSKESTMDDISSALKRRHYDTLSNYCSMFQSSVNLGEIDIAYQIAIKLLIASTDLHARRQRMISSLGRDMTMVGADQLSDGLEIVDRKPQLVDLILSGADADYIPAKEFVDDADLAPLNMAKGAYFRCSCGDAIISGGTRAYHVRCNMSMKRVSDCLYFVDQESTARFYLLAINKLYIDFFGSPGPEISNYLTRDGKFLILIGTGASEICVTNNKTIQNESSESLKDVTMVTLGDRNHVSSYREVQSLLQKTMGDSKAA